MRPETQLSSARRLPLALLAAALCLMGSTRMPAAQPGNLPAYRSELSLAWQSYTNAGYAPALSHYESAIRLAPQSLEARLGCLLPLLALERFAEAEARARQLLAQFPANYYANLRLAYALRRQGKLAEAQSTVERALGLRPTDVPLLLELALVKLARKQHATARRILFDVLTLAPDNPTALAELAAPGLAGEPRDEPSVQTGPEARPGRLWSLHAAPYYAWLRYHDTATKDHTQFMGAYATLGWGPEHLVEAEVDYLNKFYRGSPSLHQWDTTLTYANFSLPHLKLRGGAHYLMSDDSFTDQGWVAFGGVPQRRARPE